MTTLEPWQWVVAGLAALCVGVSKSGIGGVGLLTVLLMASIFPARESTGIVLPMLVFADLFAVAMFRKHVQWHFMPLLLPPAFLGIVAGFWLMPLISDRVFSPVIGGIVLLMILTHYWRRFRPDGMRMLPDSRLFAWSMGGASGVATMLANAAGPIMTLYLLARKLPKHEFVGTGAVFFFIVNLIKIPFSAGLGLIHPGSLLFSAILVPGILLGLFLGRRLLEVVPQKLFEEILLVFAALAAVRMLFA